MIKVLQSMQLLYKTLRHDACSMTPEIVMVYNCSVVSLFPCIVIFFVLFKNVVRSVCGGFINSVRSRAFTSWSTHLCKFHLVSVEFVHPNDMHAHCVPCMLQWLSRQDPVWTAYFSILWYPHFLFFFRPISPLEMTPWLSHQTKIC